MATFDKPSASVLHTIQQSVQTVFFIIMLDAKKKKKLSETVLYFN